MTPTASDLAILRFLAGRTHAAVPAIGAACRMTPNELRPRLAAMESHRLVGSRQDMGARPPVRVVYVTAEGRRAAGVVDARAGRGEGATDRGLLRHSGAGRSGDRPGGDRVGVLTIR